MSSGKEEFATALFADPEAFVAARKELSAAYKELLDASWEEITMGAALRQYEARRPMYEASVRRLKDAKKRYRSAARALSASVAWREP